LHVRLRRSVAGHIKAKSGYIEQVLDDRDRTFDAEDI
jgi:hypothetical protein